MRVGRTLATAAWAVLAMGSIARTAAAAAGPAAAAGAAAPSEVWLAVSVNDQASDQVTLFLRAADGGLLIPLTVLQSYRLRTNTLRTVTHSGEQYVRLDDLKGLRYHVDEDNQAVAINAPARLFEDVRLDGVTSAYVNAPAAPTGGFINYDVTAARTDGGNTFGGVLEASVFGAYGAAVTSVLGRSDGRSGNGVRLDSTWTRDFPDHVSSLRIGDSITGASRFWGGAIHFGGIQWGSDFSTRPGLITMPLPAVTGEAAVPSTLDVFVNDALRWKSDVQGGPFRVDQVPIVTGEGQIRVVVNDVLGRQQVFHESYYASPQLLRAGLHDYSIEAGVARDNYGIASNDYGRALVVGTDRFGVTDRLTAEFHGELLRDQQSLGIGGAFLLGTFGVISAATAASRSGRGAGELVSVGFEHTTPQFSFGVNTQYSTAAFAHLGTLTRDTIPELTTQAYVLVGMGGLGSMSLSHTRETFRGSQAMEISSLHHTINVGSLGYLEFSAIRVAGATRDTTFLLSIAHPMGARSSTSTTASTHSQGSTLEWNLQQNLPAGNGMGYRVTADAGEVRGADAALDLQNDSGTYEFEALHVLDSSTVRASAIGSLVALAGHLFASRRIDDSFALAQVGQERDVRIYRENQLVGKTDSRGLLLIPGLRPYQDNVIHLDQADVPLDVVMDSLQVNAVPWFRSGVVLRFPVERPSAALVTLRLESGDFLPAGAIIHLNDKEDEFPSGYNGEVYLTGLAARNQLRADWNGHSCTFELAYRQSEDPLPRVGPIVCRSLGN